jgi:hypothetical protein
MLIVSLLSVGLFPTAIAYSDPMAAAPTGTDPAAGQTVPAEQAIPGQILIKYKKMPDNRNFGARTVSKIPGTSYKKLSYSPNMDVSEKIEQLENDAAVAYAEPVYRISASPIAMESVYNNPSDPGYMRTWGQQVTGLVKAREYTTADQNSRVRVAVIDTGVDLDHPDLVGHLLAGKNFVTADLARNPTAPPQDLNGHGTHIAGIIAAQARDAGGFTGIAPGTSILPLKILDENGNGDTAGLVAGIEYAAQQGVDFINFSLGSYFDSRAVHDAVSSATAQGILIFAAAGNDSNHWTGAEAGQLNAPGNETGRSFGLANYPAAYPEVVSVGAVEQLTDGTLTIADFSNIGKVDIAAPGVNIYSTYPEDPAVPTDGYEMLHGTSQATAFAAGFAALLKARNPALSGGEIRQIMEDTASALPLSDLSYMNNPYGAEPTGAAEYFGNGLISGEFGYTLPRLQMALDTSLFASKRSVKATARLVDSQGAVIGQDAAASLQVWSVREDETLGNLTKIPVSETSLNLTAGEGAAALTLPNQDVYHYIVYSDNRQPGNTMIRSEFYELIRRPQTPTPDIGSGSYNNTQMVSPAGYTPGAAVYYMFTPDAEGDVVSGIYTNTPIPITESGVLALFSVKNHVFSGEAYYAYSIVPDSLAQAPSNGSGGGGVIVPEPQPAPAPTPGPIPGPGTPAPTPMPTPGPAPVFTPPDPSETDVPEKAVVPGDGSGRIVTVKPEQSKLIKLIEDSTNSEVIIDATAGGDIDQVHVIFPGEALHLATVKKKAITVKADDFTISLTPGMLGNAPYSADVTFTAQNVQASAIHPASRFQGRQRSPIYDFNLLVDGRKVTRFEVPVKASFVINTAGLNPDKLGIFRFDAALQSWEYVGGKISGGTIEAALTHFSPYAVFEIDKTFSDISGHWARKEIEALAAKQIVAGINASQFKPGGLVNRAEFASLLSRALLLDEEPDMIRFTDVPAHAWYYKGVMNAFNKGIINGVDRARFEPQKSLTREEMATMLVKAYLAAAGKQLGDVGSAGQTAYKDQKDISPWARDYVRAASVLGLMNGVQSGRFEPRGTASRAQAAKAIYQLFAVIQ